MAVGEAAGAEMCRAVPRSMRPLCNSCFNAAASSMELAHSSGFWRLLIDRPQWPTISFRASFWLALAHWRTPFGE